jgi:hypothetical protein
MLSWLSRFFFAAAPISVAVSSALGLVAIESRAAGLACFAPTTGVSAALLLIAELTAPAFSSAVFPTTSVKAGAVGRRRQKLYPIPVIKGLISPLRPYILGSKNESDSRNQH